MCILNNYDRDDEYYREGHTKFIEGEFREAKKGASGYLYPYLDHNKIRTFGVIELHKLGCKTTLSSFHIGMNPLTKEPTNHSKITRTPS